MTGTIVEQLGRLTVFMICAELLVYYRPKENYEKYLRFLVNLLVLLQFLLPVRALLGGEGKDQIRQELDGFQRELENYMEGVAMSEKQRLEEEIVRWEEQEREGLTDAENDQEERTDEPGRIEIQEITIDLEGM